MSNALAIAAVTRTLRRLIDTAISETLPLNLPSDIKLTEQIEVTAAPLDKARDSNSVKNQINLFLYHTTPNAAWRNQDMPLQVRPGEAAQPPLALNLYYLITAYGQGNNELISHLLLGRAARILHDHAVLSQIEIKDALEASDLHNQVERVRVTPQPLSLEEMSKLWTTFQTQYRISMAYEVAVVLIESQRPLRAAIPVLSRGDADRGVETVTGSLPYLEKVRFAREVAAVRLGDEMTLSGQYLEADIVKVRLRSQRQDRVFESVQLLKVTDQEIVVKLPDPGDAADPNSPTTTWNAGFYTLQVITQQIGERERFSNQLALALAPKIAITPLTATPGDLTLTITCQPMILPNQRVSLLFGDREISSPPPSAQTETLIFQISSVAAGEYLARLRVDGVDSIPVDLQSASPQFAENQKVKVT